MSFRIILFIFIILGSAHANDSNVIYNYGLISGKDKTKIYLTIDMCPSSKKKYNRDIFVALQDLSKQQNRAIPIAIAITGKWIINHEQALQEIKDFESKGYISITWVNHSYYHFYDKNLPLKDNFMLHNINDAVSDIQENEETMKKYGLKNSKFFRFPGLISNNQLNAIIEDLGYKILGTNAWLAKTNGQFSGGDIILIHGNLNEQKGVDLFLENLKQNKFANFKFSPLEDLSKE